MTQETDTTAIKTRDAFKINIALDKLFGRDSQGKHDWTPSAGRTSDKILFTSVRRRDARPQKHAAPEP